MRLPFSSRKAQEPSDSSRRSSLNEDKDSEDPSSFRNATDVNSEAIGQTKSAPIDTPATSFSSYSSYNNREGKKAGMYKLSGMFCDVSEKRLTLLQLLTIREHFCRYVHFSFDTSIFVLMDQPSPPDTGKSKGSKAWSLHRKSNRSRERMSSFDGPFIISRESFEVLRKPSGRLFSGLQAIVRYWTWRDIANISRKFKFCQFTPTQP